MKRKLLLLNLALLVTLCGVAWRLRQDWLAARAREQALVRSVATPLPPPPVIFGKSVDPVLAAGYAEIAQRMLFSKDRNPNVVVEVKPPKPMPPLPLLFGVMDLPDGTTAVMAEKTGARHVGVRLGDKVGEFTLLAVSHDDITLEWDGNTLVKKIDELIDRAGAPQPSSEGTGQRSAPAPMQSSAKTDIKPAGRPEPGVDVGNGVHACQAGDTSPKGTVSGGFRKDVTPTPFGDSCRWVPI